MRGNDGEIVGRLSVSIPIVKTREKQFVADNGASKHAAKLILPVNAA